jgi:hypothetical protein
MDSTFYQINNLMNFLKYVLIIISFQSVSSDQVNLSNKTIRFQNVTVFVYNQSNVNFSLPSVSSNLISNITVNSSRSCFIKCKLKGVCKSYVFTNDEIINCYLYNRTFHYSEILEHNGTAVFILKSDPITLLTTPVFGHTRLPTTLINVKIQNNTQGKIFSFFIIYSYIKKIK